MKTKLLLFCIIVMSAACSKDELKYDPDNPILGTWIIESYNDTIYTFNRADSFVDNHCFRFNSDGTMTERKNSGWCGTPPVTYSDFEGYWSSTDDSIIEVNVGYWGGLTSYTLNILKLDKTELKLTFRYHNK